MVEKFVLILLSLKIFKAKKSNGILEKFNTLLFEVYKKVNKSFDFKKIRYAHINEVMIFHLVEKFLAELFEKLNVTTI